jgi:hypothetical protein
VVTTGALEEIPAEAVDEHHDDVLDAGRHAVEDARRERPGSVAAEQRQHCVGDVCEAVVLPGGPDEPRGEFVGGEVAG